MVLFQNQETVDKYDKENACVTKEDVTGWNWQVDSISVSLFTNIRRQDPYNYSDTETRSLVYRQVTFSCHIHPVPYAIPVKL